LREIFELPEPNSGDDLEAWPPELIGIKVQEGAGGVDALLPALLDALEVRSGGGQVDAGQARPAVPLADLVLRLRAPRFELVKNPQGADVRRPVATATLAFYPPDAAAPAADSRALHARLWEIAAQPGPARRRIHDTRTVLTLRAFGITEFATANVKDFEAIGFVRVWNPMLRYCNERGSIYPPLTARRADGK